MKKPLPAVSKLITIAAAITLLASSARAQTKIGNNPGTVNNDAVLELESTSKGLLMSRVALSSTTNASPLSAHVEGMTVYNTATAGDVMPGFYFDNGTRWVRIANSVSSYTSSSSATSSTPTAAVEGNIIYDQSCGCAKLYTGGTFVQLNANDHAQAMWYADTTAANAAIPTQKITGNIIYDLSSNGLKLYTGTKWITPTASPLNYMFADTTAANITSPNIRVAGQQIYDNSCSCLKVFADGGWRMGDGSLSNNGIGFSAGTGTSGSLINLAISLSLGGSSQQVNFNAEEYDNGNAYISTSTDSKFTAPYTGIYHFDVGILTGVTGNVLGNYNVYLVVGSSIRHTQPLASIGTGNILNLSTQGQANFSKDLKLNAGDVVRVVIGNSGLLGLGISLVQGGTYFDGHLVK